MFIIDCPVEPVEGRHEKAFARTKTALCSGNSTADGRGKLTGEMQRILSATAKARPDAPRAGTEIATVCRVRGQRLRYAAATDAVRRASYDHHGDVDQDRGELLCAALHLRRGARQWGCAGLLWNWPALARVRSSLSRPKAGRGRTLTRVCLQASRLPPVQLRLGAHSAKPLPSCCSLRGAATGYLKCVYRPR